MCKPEPCLNGGTCQNYGSSYNCLCPKGFTGTNCEKSIIFFNLNLYNYILYVSFILS